MPKFEDEFEFPDEKEAKGKLKAEDDKAEDLKIEIEDDTPPQDRGRKPMAEPPEDPTDEELSSYDEKVQSRIKKFTRGYHDERRAKEQAERERLAAEEFARQVFEENKRLKEQLSTGSKVFIEQHQTTAQSEVDAAKSKVKEAFENGDADAMAAAQELLAKATLRAQRAQEMRPIEMEEKEFKPPARSEAPKMDDRTRRWVDSNKEWFGTDDEMTMAAMGLDRKLQKEYGASYIGTEDYFRKIDSVMRKRFPDYFGSKKDEDSPRNESEPADEDDSPRRATKPASVVAPATRSTPPTRVRLKESQVALARKLGITPEQYAKQVALLNRGE